MNIVAVKQPSAIIPIVMSVAALATVLVHILIFGTAPQPDEGTAAHIWQLLMARPGTARCFLFHQVAPTNSRYSPACACGADRSRPRGGWSRILARMVATGGLTLRARRVYGITVALGSGPFLFGFTGP